MDPSLGLSSPLVRKLLRLYGINPADIVMRECATRITKRDIERYMSFVGEMILLETELYDSSDGITGDRARNEKEF